MAAPDVSLCIDDPTDPAHLTPEQRLNEVGALLALGLRRWSTLRVAGEAGSESPTPADSKTISANPT